MREVSLAAAKALDVPYLIASGADGGEYSYAAVYHDVPGLLLERGYGGFCRDEWIAGLCYPAVRENDRVVKGQLLGRLEDMFGNVAQEFYAESDGVIFYYTGGLAVGEGDSLAAYGLDD